MKNSTPGSDPYLKPGRLADVITLLQVMSAAKRPEARIEVWAQQLDQNEVADTTAHWLTVFKEHPEFFKVYKLEGKDKAALRLRYVFKTYDAETGKEYKPNEIDLLDKATKKLLTTKPLTVEQTQILINTAIALHTRALNEQSASRYWIPLLAAGLAFVGAILGAVLTSLLKRA